MGIFRNRSPAVTRKDVDKVWAELAEVWQEMDFLYQHLRTNKEEFIMASAAIQADVQAILDTISTVKADFDNAFAQLQANEDADVIAAFQPVADKLSALDAAAKNQPAPAFQTNPDTSGQGAATPAASADTGAATDTTVAETPPGNTADTTNTG